MLIVVALAIPASLAWVVPTFLLAIFMQEIQAEIYELDDEPRA